MACVNCSKIRAAILHGKMAEAAGLSVQALREKFGLEVAPVAAAEAEPLDEPANSEPEPVEQPRTKRARKAG
jgi:hypothetical protein